MTNAYYTKGAEKILAPLIGGAALTGTLKAAAVKNTYPQSLGADEFYTAISAYVVGAPVALSGANVTGGRLDANDPVFAALAAGNTLEAVVLYMDTGFPATSPLIAYIDQIGGFPLATNGFDFTPQWDNGPFKILSLL
jgi:hypothetical protein